MMLKKNSKAKVVTSIIQHVNTITDTQINFFRNSTFDNMGVKLLISGHRESFEFLEEIVRKDKLEFSGELMDDIDSLTILHDYFIKTEDFSREGRFNQVSMAYCEVAKHSAFKSQYWLQELVMERALTAAERYQADGGKQLAYCQLELVKMLEATFIRNLRNQNMIHGNKYVVKPPSRCLNLLTSCLTRSTGRSNWVYGNIQYEFISAGHLARTQLASSPENEENLKTVIKLSEQANCIWLESLSNYYLAKILASDRSTEAIVLLQRGLEVLENISSTRIDQNIWSNNETCMQAPSFDRLAGMCSVLLAKLYIRTNNEISVQRAVKLLEGFLLTWQEISDERADAYILLGEIYDRHFYNPEKAVECYHRAYSTHPTSDSARVSMGIANSHLLLDGIMKLLDTESKISKRLLVWKDQPDDFEHDLESD